MLALPCRLVEEYRKHLTFHGFLAGLLVALAQIILFFWKYGNFQIFKKFQTNFF
jgi:hypothetical protein